MKCAGKIEVEQRRREGTGNVNARNSAVTYCFRSEYLQPQRLSQLPDLSHPNEKTRGTRAMKKRKRRKEEDSKTQRKMVCV
jgi:hypothetical protein